ncbi:hypothetical protein TRFO_42755 [Tritrichomonas foetus]|uniref:COPI associated protein n=1 Tax=Tritrichomonas foetus TaxID=1144522 RepID=A0A1J4KUP6_9EUKA|nr:hypothetical protein TRFO_42755 [Tritrichomonas foetus]|eukprot:OHT15001.1 hypothetical protein TRFO_42755 [Tritrichomonas foetus]
MSDDGATQIKVIRIKKIDLPIAIVSAISQVLAMITYCITLNKRWNSWRAKLNVGYSPSHYNVNMHYYICYLSIIFTISSILFAALEIGLIFDAIHFKIKLLRSRLVRGLIYFFKGFATLGLSGTFGVFSGFIEIIIGGILIIFDIVLLIKNRGKSGTTQSLYENDGFVKQRDSY